MLPLFQQRNVYNNNMADINKTKLQLRSGLSVNGNDKTPSPATKLLISHGKPNFTIPRSYNKQNGNASPTSPPPSVATLSRNFQLNNNNTKNSNNNEFVVKSTTFNGVFKPSTISAATRQTLPQNGNSLSKTDNDNEAAKVVLRRPKVVKEELGERENDDNVPEFILRQRRIQERLANQNILDFENRRSGYFTQVLISPSSPNRQSFVETMSSPAVKPGLEMSPLAAPQEDTKTEAYLEKQEEPEQKQEEVEHNDAKTEAYSKEEQQEEVEETQRESEQQEELENGGETVKVELVTLNGQLEEEEEEVAKAIEEVNKAVEGEDDDKIELEDHKNISQQPETKETEPFHEAATDLKVEEIQPKNDEKPREVTTALESSSTEVTPNSSLKETSPEHDSVPTSEANVEVHQINGHVEEQQVKLDSGITISHVNGTNGPSIPAPDPSGEKGANFEAKTVVSFSQELGNGENKYPDTIKVLKDAEVLHSDGELKELTKLKFEIKADDNQDIEVKPVLVKETA